MKLELVSFTDRGGLLAEWLVRELAGAGHAAAYTRGRGTPGFSLREWTAQAFALADGLVFIGAAGIAVRAIAPLLRDKAHDPAVVVLDEGGRFAVPLLSGHLGGANELANTLASLTGGTSVITTATDARGVFAVDSWARRQSCRIPEPECIKNVSAKLLAGDKLSVGSMFPVFGEPPAGVELTAGPARDVDVTVHSAGEGALRLVPPAAVLGVGCRRGAAAEAIEAAFMALGIDPLAVCQVCSIDLKAHEPGLLEFCRAHNWELRTFTAAELAAVEGEFSHSDFVAQATGVDNVCERAAVLGSGGELYIKKQARDGVTVALALRRYTMDWSW